MPATDGRRKSYPGDFRFPCQFLDDVDTVRPDNMQAAQLLTGISFAMGISVSPGWEGKVPHNPGRAGGGLLCNSTKIWPAVHSDWVLECTSSQKQAAEAIRRFYVITRPSVLWFAITKLLDGGMVWFAESRAAKRGKRSRRYFEQQVSLAAFTDATPTTLMIYLLPGPARQRGNLVSHLGSHDAKNHP